jgi:hypothetical protein
MVQMTDVNTTDIVDAIRLGCQSMAQVFNPEDGDLPYFRVIAHPEAYLDMPMPDHVPGRHINALLNAAEVAGIEVEEDVIDKHAAANYLSFGGPVALSLGREDCKGPLKTFSAHHIREAFHALYPLVQYRNSERARKVAEACIDAVFEYFDLEAGWDYDRLESEHALKCYRDGSFVTGVARSIGPLVKYYRATGYGPALELAIALKEKALAEVFKEDGSYDSDVFGTHAHSITCTLSSLAQLADLTSDSTLLQRVKAFFDHGLWEMRDELGWSIEGTRSADERSDEGEMNNTGDILETALILGRWGYSEYYHDAERILRCHLLPSQLRDISFVREPQNPDGIDRLTNVAARVRGCFGFPAPYGHQPIGNQRIRFNTDVVGGSVGSLCTALREVARFEKSGHWINLLFDHETAFVKIESPYTHPALRIQVKKPAPLFVRIPPWVDRSTLKLSPAETTPRYTNGYLFIAEPPVNRPLKIEFPLVQQEITLKHQVRAIRTRLRGDAVEAMDNFGADLTFFDPLQ